MPLLEGPLPLVASIALRGGEFIAEVKKRPDAEIVEVTQGNRDTLPRKSGNPVSVHHSCRKNEPTPDYAWRTN